MVRFQKLSRDILIDWSFSFNVTKYEHKKSAEIRMAETTLRSNMI